MTLQEAITAVSNRLGQRTMLDEEIKTELGLSQILYESAEELPWFLRVRSSGTAASTIALPSNFLSELVDEPFIRLILDNGAYKPLVKKALWEVDDYRAAEASTPQYYVVEPTQVILLPPPDKTYNIEILYLGADTPIASVALNGTNKWLTYAPFVLVNDAGYRISMSLRSPETAQLFAAHLQEAQRAMWRKHYAMAQNARGVALGG